MTLTWAPSTVHVVRPFDDEIMEPHIFVAVSCVGYWFIKSNSHREFFCRAALDVFFGHELSVLVRFCAFNMNFEFHCHVLGCSLDMLREYTSQQHVRGSSSLHHRVNSKFQQQQRSFRSRGAAICKTERMLFTSRCSRIGAHPASRRC